MKPRTVRFDRAMSSASGRAESRVTDRLDQRVRFIPKTPRQTSDFRQRQRAKPRHSTITEYLNDIHAEGERKQK